MFVDTSGMTRDEIKKEIKADGWFIANIENPDAELQLLAVAQNPFCIRAIDNPVDATQIAAVEQFHCCIKYIKRPCQEVIDRAHDLYPISECISPEGFKYKFYEPVYETMDQIKYDFNCYFSETDRFFKCKSLKAAMNSLIRKNKNGPWNLDNYKGPSQFDIRKIDFNNINYCKGNITEYFEYLGKTEFQHGSEVDGYYLLPCLFEADYCPDGHADYLVFRYEGDLYLLTLLCFE
jgi:hypothetical protein